MIKHLTSTKISIEELLKLNLVGIKHRMVENKDGTKSLQFITYSVNQEVKELLDDKDKLQLKDIVVCVHKKSTDESLSEYERQWDSCYFDKYLTRLGACSILIAYNLGHLYATRDYLESREDYFKVRKDETEVCYEVTCQ